MKKIKWKFRNSTNSTTGLILLLVTFLMATSGFDLLPYQEKEALARVRKMQPIEVLILENPLTYHLDRTNRPWGIDVERLQSFSQYAGLQYKPFYFKSADELTKAFKQGRGHIVISRQHMDLDRTVMGPLFEEIRQGVFCRRSLKVKGAEELHNLNVVEAQWPLQTTIKQIQNRKIDCFVSEAREGTFATQSYLAIEKIGEAPTNFHHTWYIRHELKDLQNVLTSWYHKATRNGDFAVIDHRFEATLSTLRPSDIRSFFEKVSSKLPEYQLAFKEVAVETQLPWTLIAAVAYQESKWNHAAVSFTGVKGLMQLTMQTAKHMGIEDREDPFQSIWGGARYIQHLWQEWAEIRNPRDRLLVTLASYNGGIAHIFDVMEVLKQDGKNPYHWQNIEEVLPRLEDPEFCEQLPYGCARGRETVEFVKRVYSYYQLLSIKR